MQKPPDSGNSLDSEASCCIPPAPAGESSTSSPAEVQDAECWREVAALAQDSLFSSSLFGYQAAGSQLSNPTPCHDAAPGHELLKRHLHTPRHAWYGDTRDKVVPDAQETAPTRVLCSSSWPCTALSSSKHRANSIGLLELKQKCPGRSRIYIS